VMIDDPNKPAWAGNFFTGVPAPAGALVVLLPIYLSLLGWFNTPAILTLVYTLAIAALMVSRIPVFSGKKVGKRVSPEIVLPIFVVIVIFLALLISYPWEVLSVGTLLYLAALPLGWLSYRDYERKAASEGTSTTKAVVGSPPSPGETRPSSMSGDSPPDQDRPSRLN